MSYNRMKMAAAIGLASINMHGMVYRDEYDKCDSPTIAKNVKEAFKEPLKLSELDKIRLQKAEEKRRRKALKRLNERR